MGVAEIHEGVFALFRHAQHGEVCLGVLADQFRVQFAAILQDNLNCGRAIHDVIIGDDVAIFRDEEARAERTPFLGFRLFFLFLAALFHELVQARHAAELFEELLHVCQAANFALRGNIHADNRRLDLLDQVRKAERRTMWSFNLNRLGAGLRAEDLWGQRERAHHRDAYQRCYHGLSRYADCLHSCLQVTEKFAGIGHVVQTLTCHKHCGH